MIYEIFKFAFESVGHPWLAYAGAVLLATYCVYILGWLCGWVLSMSHAFVYDGQKTLDNIMWKYVKFLRGDANAYKKLYNGWYAVKDSLSPHGGWLFYKYDNGREVNHTDYASTVSRDGGLQDRPSKARVGGFLFFKCWDVEPIVFASPFVLVVLFLAADSMPMVAACVGMYYALLLIARKAVRIGTKLNEHINDVQAHSGQTSKSDTQ